MRTPWIGVDLDGTLAHYDGWRGHAEIGDPIPEMVARVKAWIAEGKTVKVFTARVSTTDAQEREEARLAIYQWTQLYIGEPLAVTCRKDFSMIELWDDRAVRVVTNTGKPCCQGLDD